MVSIKDHGVLEGIIGHCVRIEETLIDVSKEQFKEDKGLKDIVCFNIFQIGELAKHLSDEITLHYTAVPWVKIMGMRDRIGHGYGTIDLERVWMTAIKDIRPLHEYCEAILQTASKRLVQDMGHEGENL